MRAALVERYGGPEVARVAEVPTPEPGPGQVLVRVHAAAVTAGDARIRAARFPRGFALPARLAFGITRPRRRILGGVFSGVVAAVGEGVAGIADGAAVCGMTGMRMGAHAECVAVPAARLVPVPEGVSHEDAAGVLFGGTTALHFLRRRGGVGPGMSVLVIGASGAVGTNAVQLAHAAGAVVTAVSSGANSALVMGLGAGRVIDHTVADVTRLGERFDVVMDTVGALTMASGRRLLAPGGRLLLVAADLGQTVRARGAVAAGTSGERPEDMAELIGMVAAGTLRVVHDAAFPLDRIAEAYARVDTGRKTGNVLVRP
ncbi:MAG: NAD(P)-dependent alcohol dehydrogenase [Thermoleophilia bacterium]|nr:NAD(P)-dependent alcohol dehydrogenase [Thermoleophilia bacterium]